MTPDHQTKTVGFWFSHFFTLSYALIHIHVIIYEHITRTCPVDIFLICSYINTWICMYSSNSSKSSPGPVKWIDPVISQKGRRIDRMGRKRLTRLAGEAKRFIFCHFLQVFTLFFFATLKILSTYTTALLNFQEEPESNKCSVFFSIFLNSTLFL